MIFLIDIDYFILGIRKIPLYEITELIKLLLPSERYLSTIILHFTGKQRTYIPTYHRRIYSTGILSDIFPPVIESVYLHGKSLPNPDFHSEVCFIFLFRLDPLRRKTTLCQSSCRSSTYENICLSGTIELFVHIIEQTGIIAGDTE